jgi:hypothetical protein
VQWQQQQPVAHSCICLCCRAAGLFVHGMVAVVAARVSALFVMCKGDALTLPCGACVQYVSCGVFVVCSIATCV